jgi:hypothetical protein
MANKEVNIFFKVEGLDGYITNLDDLKGALEDVDTATKKASDSQEQAAKKVGVFGKALRAAGKLGKGAFQAIGAGIKATGLGIFLDLGARLVEWFNQTDVGAKLIEGSLATLGVIFNKIGEYTNTIIESFKPLFEDPLASIQNFGKAIQDNISNKINSIIEGLGFLGTAISKLFEGDFSGAADAAGQAFQKIVVDGTVLGDVIDGVNAVVETTVEVFNDVADAVVEAVVASNALVDAQNRLKERTAELTVDNAKLNQELETQQRIADDTTLSYEQRKEALDRVNAANEQLAANAVEQAQLELDALQRAYDLANTDAERRELKQQLADATATLIDAETAAELVRLESAQLNRELDQEEIDRLEELRIQKEEAAQKAKEDADKARAEELAAIKAQNEAIVAAEQQLQDAKFNAASSGISALSALAGENEKIQNALFIVDKAVAAGKVVVDSIKAKAANLAYAAGLGPAGPAYLAAANQAVNLNTAANLAVIAATTIAKFKSGVTPESQTGGVNINPSGITNYGIGGQEAGGQIGLGQTSSGQPQPIQAYVIASDVTNAQQANQQIQNLSRL